MSMLQTACYPLVLVSLVYSLQVLSVPPLLILYIYRLVSLRITLKHPSSQAYQNLPLGISSPPPLNQ